LTMTKNQPQAAPVVAIQRMVGVHDRAQHLRTGMDQTLQRLAQKVQQATPRPTTRTK
jgi:ABC-type hemin transport system substrate-binding protein